MKRVIGLCGMVLMGLVVASCGGSGGAVENKAPLPAGLFAGAAPADAKNVKELRKDAKEGDKVVVLGRVAGRKDPFSPDRAVVLIAERSMKSCTEAMPADGCKTPWDFCCDDAKEVAASLATVQVVDGEGKPLKTTLEGAGNLKPLSEVVVKGTVSKRDENTLVINAEEIFVKN